MNSFRMGSNATTWSRRVCCAVIVATLAGVVAVASADPTPVLLSTTTNLRAYAFWEDWSMGDSAVDEQFGEWRAYAEANLYGYTMATAQIETANTGWHWRVDTELTGGGVGPTWSNSIGEVQSGTLTIGTSTAYPAGTPLLLKVAAYTTGDDGAVSNSVDIQLSRGSDVAFAASSWHQLEPTEWTVVVYAGETFTPWIRHSFSTDEESGASYLHVDMWTEVPEPATLALLMLGGLTLRRR